MLCAVESHHGGSSRIAITFQKTGRSEMISRRQASALYGDWRRRVDRSRLIHVINGGRCRLGIGNESGVLLLQTWRARALPPLRRLRKRGTLDIARKDKICCLYLSSSDSADDAASAHFNSPLRGTTRKKKYINKYKCATCIDVGPRQGAPRQNGTTSAKVKEQALRSLIKTGPVTGHWQPERANNKKERRRQFFFYPRADT